MATLAFVAAGKALGAGVLGQALGVALGSYIDSRFVYPKLFPPPDVGAPNIGDLQFQFAEEGSPVPYVLGSQSRVTGTLRWAGIPREEKIEQDIGGCGGGSQVVGYRYKVHCAIKFCEAPPQGISRIVKIWAAGKGLIYDSDPDITVNSTQLSVTRVEEYAWVSPDMPNVLVRVYMDVQSPNGGPDLSRFRSGVDVQVSGFANGGNNGTFRCVSAEKSAATGVSKVRFRNTACVTEAAGATATLFQDLPHFSTSHMAGLTLYNGSAGQGVDPLIAALHGADTPAFRGEAQAVFEDLNITEFGNTIPEMSALIEAQAPPLAMADAVNELMVRAKLDPSTDFDVSGLTGELFGLNARGPQRTTELIQPLAVAYDVVAQQREGKIAFFHRQNAPVVVVDPIDLGARLVTGEPVEPLDERTEAGDNLPDEVNVQYQEPKMFWQTGSQRERHSFDGRPREVSASILPITMTAGQARGLARKLFWKAHAERESVRLSLPPSYVSVREGDVLTFSYKGEPYRLAVTRVDITTDWLIQVEAIPDVPELDALGDGPAEDPVGPTTGGNVVVALPGEMLLDLLDIPAMRSGHELLMGYYYASAMASPTSQFQGGYVYESTDGSTFTQGAQITAEATIGRASGILGSTSIVGWFDEVSTVTVVLENGSLSSRSEAQVLAGSNRAVIGGEIVGFKNASLTGTRTYLLSGFLRGLHDTHDAIPLHVAGDRFVLLTSLVQTSFAQLNAAAIGSTRYYKPVSAGQSPASVISSQALQHVGATLRQWSPAQALIRKKASGDYLISWLRRCRAPIGIFKAGGLPLLDSQEIYEVEIWTAGFAQLKRTLTATGVTNVTYTAADQAFDSITAPLNLRIYMVGTLAGRSKKLEAATLAIKEFE